MRFHRRRVRTRRIRKSPDSAAPATPPAVDPIHLAPTDVGAPAVRTELPPIPASDPLLRFAAPTPSRDPSEETEGALPALREDAPAAPELAVEGEAPARLEFNCPCGTRLIATTETYDKHTRCAMCSTVLLLNLVYDPEQNTHEIVPFRVQNNPPSSS